MSLRDLPSVERLLQTQAAHNLVADYGRPLTLEAIRHRLEATRAALRDGGEAPPADALLEQVRRTLEGWLTPSLRPVINATGVILHTNLGRAPLSRAARRAVEAVAVGYSNLELDLARGTRGQRDAHVDELLRHLTGAEAALVVNNNAAAVLLALTCMARRKEVLISRGQLVEIGGGFRLPEVMRQSGARLVEVGTTNRTHRHDFVEAISERTALIVCAHHSNFRIVGYTTEPGLAELVGLGREHGLPVLHDLGSGALLDTAAFGLAHEPTVQESLQAGAAVVAFSGDKLLGGPQAGILVGKSEDVERMRRHPLARAARADKLCLAGLSATLAHYLRDEAIQEIPIWQMIAVSPEELRRRAEGWRERLGQGEVVAGRSAVGGGSLPEETLPSWLLALAPRKANDLAARLRAQDPPVVARVEDERLLFDPRTVLPEQETDLLRSLRAALGGGA
jgi:L-seryl-tRNA(Ser) seleniumtransferase